MVECFSIYILQSKSENVFDVENNTKCVYSRKCLEPFLKINPTIILADPFLFVHNNELYLFYESKGYFTPGVLMMVKTKDLEHWTEPITVLRESYHLSYPFVFEDNGCVYMLPETGTVGEIRLYKADDESLTHFSFEKTLVKQPSNRVIRMGYGDSSIYKKEGDYYLMTMLQYEDPINTLELYISNNLYGPYKAHPCSPIIKSMKVGRDAGSWIEYEGKLYRVSQDCIKRYGDNVNVSEIIMLTNKEYKEELIKENILPYNNEIYKEGGHQFNTVIFKGKRLVATDAKEYHSMLCWRIANKLKRVFE